MAGSGEPGALQTNSEGLVRRGGVKSFRGASGTGNDRSVQQEARVRLDRLVNGERIVQGDGPSFSVSNKLSEWRRVESCSKHRMATLCAEVEPGPWGIHQWTD